MDIRLYEPSDEAETLKILRRGLLDQGRCAGLADPPLDGDFFEPAWAEHTAHLREHPALWWVGVEGGQVVAAMRFEYPWHSAVLREPFEPHGMIVQLNVHPNARNRGVGRAMIEKAEALARDSCVGAVAATAFVTNPVVRLYRRCGFADVPERLRVQMHPAYVVLWKRFGPVD